MVVTVFEEVLLLIDFIINGLWFSFLMSSLFDCFVFVFQEDDSLNDPEMDKLGKGKEQAAEDFEGELQVSASAFEALERDFQEVCR